MAQEARTTKDPEDPRLVTLGWHGIGATGVSFMVDSARAMNDFDGRCWLAIGASDGEVAVSLWTGRGPSSRRLALWMPPDAARKLGEALIRASETPDAP